MSDRTIQIQDGAGHGYQIEVSVPQETLNQIGNVVAFLSALPTGGSNDAKAKAMTLVNALDGRDVTKDELWEAVKTVARRAKFYPAPSEIMDEIFEIRQREFSNRRFGIPVMDCNGEVRIRLVSEEEYDAHEKSLGVTAPDIGSIKQLPEIAVKRMPE